MATIDELRAQAQIIADETQIGGNTAERIGETFDTTADLIEGVAENVTTLANDTYTKEEVDEALEGKQDVFNQADKPIQVSENSSGTQLVLQGNGGEVTEILDTQDTQNGWIHAGDGAIPSVGLVARKLSEETTRAETAEGALADDIEAIEGKIPTAASASNQLADKAFVGAKIVDTESVFGEHDKAPSGYAVGATFARKDELSDVTDLIPTQASSTNQLADKTFVNSSISTNTANYISDNGSPFPNLATLQAYSGTLTNNDYAFVVGTDADGNTTYTRYKYNASTSTWAEEYVLNNSSFTAAQWAAIQSGITALLVTKLQGLPTGTQYTSDLAGKQDKIQTFNDSLASIPEGTYASGTTEAAYILLFRASAFSGIALGTYRIGFVLESGSSFVLVIFDSEYNVVINGDADNNYVVTYQHTLDAVLFGRVNATTLAGKGITDAYTKTEVDAIFDSRDTDEFERQAEAIVTPPIEADFDTIPLLCGQPMKLYSNGTPAEAIVPDNWTQFADGGYNWDGTPSALGQEVIDYANGVKYEAVRDGLYELKWLQV